MATSSFEYRPGVPLFTSTNLVDWAQIGHVLTRSSQLPDSDGRGSTGIYAPTLRHHRGRFWMVTTNVTHPGSEQIVCWAHSPEGPWSDCAVTTGCRGIDPDLSWDGQDCYLTWTTSDPNNPAILQVLFDPETARSLESPRVIWRGTGLAYPEAPHFYRKDDWWYLMLAEGGTERGHAITMARSRSIRGPFEEAPSNPVFSHRSLLHPVQNTGHGDLIQRPDGSWAMVYLGVRPSGTSPGFHVNGRETFVASVDWRNDWPQFDEAAFQVPSQRAGFVEDFTEARLNDRWVAPGVFPSSFVQLEAGSGVKLSADKGKGNAMLLTRVRDAAWDCELDIEHVHGAASAVLRMDHIHRLEVEVSQEHISCALHLKGATVTLCRLPSTGSASKIIFNCRPTRGGEFMALEGPDMLSVSIVQDGKEVDLGAVDGRYLSTEVAGGFTGRMIGVRSLSGEVTFKRCTYRPVDW